MNTGPARPARIFDALTRPGAMCGFSSPGSRAQGGVRTSPVPLEISEPLRNATRVVADDPAAWYWQSELNDWDLRGNTDFGPLRLPFDTLWIEWAPPLDIRVNGRWRRHPYGDAYAFGMFLFRGKAGHETMTPGAAEIISFTCATMNVRQGLPVLLSNMHMIGVDEQGRVLDTQTLSFQQGPGLSESEESLINGAWAEAKAGLLALSLMNCKNVKLGLETPRPVKHKKSRRVRPAGLAYHTIQLPHAASGSRSDRSAAMGGGVALHKVRGSFATYTDDSKLFGKYTGTYWRPWHMQGNAELGTIEAGYSVRRR